MERKAVAERFLTQCTFNVLKGESRQTFRSDHATRASDFSIPDALADGTAVEDISVHPALILEWVHPMTHEHEFLSMVTYMAARRGMFAQLDTPCLKIDFVATCPRCSMPVFKDHNRPRRDYDFRLTFCGFCVHVALFSPAVKPHHLLHPGEFNLNTGMTMNLFEVFSLGPAALNEVWTIDEGEEQLAMAAALTLLTTGDTLDGATPLDIKVIRRLRMLAEEMRRKGLTPETFDILVEGAGFFLPRPADAPAPEGSRPAIPRISVMAMWGIAILQVAQYEGVHSTPTFGATGFDAFGENQAAALRGKARALVKAVESARVVLPIGLTGVIARVCSYCEDADPDHAAVLEGLSSGKQDEFVSEISDTAEAWAIAIVERNTVLRQPVRDQPMRLVPVDIGSTAEGVTPVWVLSAPSYGVGAGFTRAVRRIQRARRFFEITMGGL